MKTLPQVIRFGLILASACTISIVYGADGDRNLCNTMLLAAVRADSGAVQELITAGVSVNSCNREGKTPLMIAAQFGHGALVDLLLAARADIDQVDYQSRSALFYAIGTKKIDIVQKLALHGASLTRASTGGVTPLMAACIANCIATVWFLLERGVDPNDGDVTTALDQAIIRQNTTMIDYLVAYGADINRKPAHGIAPLILAASCTRDPEVVECLIRRNADVMLMDSAGLTALAHARARGKDRIAQLILSHMPEQIDEQPGLKCEHE